MDLLPLVGRLCQQDINECVASNPCRNGATCQNTEGSYICQCLTGYEGRHCDVNPDDCVPGRRLSRNAFYLRLRNIQI